MRVVPAFAAKTGTASLKKTSMNTVEAAPELAISGHERSFDSSREARKPSICSSRNERAEFACTPPETPRSSRKMKVLMPATLPVASSNGPPLLPGFMTTSYRTVSGHFSSIDATLACVLCSGEPMTEEVFGYPSAITGCPGLRLFALKTSGGRSKV